MTYFIRLAIGLLIDLWSLITCLFTGIPVVDKKTDSDDICILIPGIFGNATCFSELAKYIKSEKKSTSIHVFQYDAFEQMDTIIEKLTEYCMNYSGKKITMIGHSYGGLVACYMLYKATDLNITKIYTIASPLKGAVVKDFYESIMTFLKQYPAMGNLHDAIKDYEKSTGFSNVIKAINESPIDKVHELNKVNCIEASKDFIVGPYASPSKYSKQANSDCEKSVTAAHQNVLKNPMLINSISSNI